MTIPLYGSVGALFNRLGKLGLTLKQAKQYQASQFINFVNTTTGVVAQFNEEADIQAIMGDNYISLLNSFGNVLGNAQTMTRATVNRMVFRDNPQLGQTLTSQNVLQSISEIIRQMTISGDTVTALTVTGTPTAFTGIGNGVVNVSVRRPLDGRVLENTFAENMLLTCTADSYLGGAQAGNETLTLTGTGTEDPMSFDWPLGSNCSTTLNAINALQDNSEGNILTNSSWEDWTGGVPDNWTIVTGAATIAEENTIVYSPITGGKALRITGDGATLTTFKQRFDDTTGTVGALQPLTQYSLAVWLRRDGVAPAAGQLTIEIVDGNNNVINDVAGIANSVVVDLTTLSTVYTAYLLDVRMPLALATTDYYIQFRENVALTNNRAVYLDNASLGLMTQAYVGGPFAACHGGSIPFVQGDFATIAFTNSRGTGATAFSTWQSLLGILLPEALSAEVIWPSAAVGTISNTLIG